MDLFVHNVPEQSKERDIRKFLKGPLSGFGVSHFLIEKPNNKPFAIVTVGDKRKAQSFLAVHGQMKLFTGRFTLAKIPLVWGGKKININESHRAVDPLKIGAVLKLENEHREQISHNANSQQPANTKENEQRQNRFKFDVLQCGHWHYVQSTCCYATEYRNTTGGEVVFGANSLIIILGSRSSLCRIESQYLQIDSINLETENDASITLTLMEGPTISKTRTATLSELFGALDMSQSKPKLQRATGIEPLHVRTAGISLIYRMKLSNRRELSFVQRFLKSKRNAPSITNIFTAVISTAPSMQQSFDMLQQALSDPLGFGKYPFKIIFQLSRLARNTFLHPNEVRHLLPVVERLYGIHGLIPVVEALRKLSKNLRVRAPHVPASVFSLDELTNGLEEFVATFHEKDSIFDIKDRHRHLVLVHRALVTPSGLYLEGPGVEQGNRVLRKYSEHSDMFLRVEFADENGYPVQYDPRWTPEDIYHKRFRAVLGEFIAIGGHNFSFLGFSHSSLRAQSCWFMAPFVHDRELVFSTEIIARLGDFSAIRSPAKCAARIGQAFSETYSSVAIAPKNYNEIVDVERNGRVFSDGCGTVSFTLLKRIWKGYAAARKRSSTPTLLQIRFAGAKGVVSLDTRIPGEKLCLRPSMLKFEGSNSWDIEICGANFRPLPMYLNRGLVKIMEDLGVPAEAFLDLQKAQMEKIMRMTQSSANAASFLELNHMCTAHRLPNLLRMIGRIGLEFSDDEFLKNVIDMCAVTQLRELKYRSRILVEKGVTLYGIMDETEFLEDGEICIRAEKNGPKIGCGKVVITRAPQNHPGDIRVVRAVEPPAGSPLWDLENCIIFSSKGVRDLPSQLSGGDLDGDLFNIIYDERLYPQLEANPADYPRPEALDIGRKVELADMADFFVNFMESDRLGMISINHLQLSDRYAEGTLHPDCIQLAGMASTAVDFSKTGIPVDMASYPKFNRRLRPDFLAPGPRIIMQDSGPTILDDEELNDEDEDDLTADLLPRSHHYYTSRKVLGQLYRAIDEERFLRELNVTRASGTYQPDTRVTSLMEKLWGYVRRESITVQWEHYREEAKEIMESYYQNLIEICTTYSLSNTQPLSEVEVFSNNILGRDNGKQSRQTRELNRSMKEHWDRDLAYTRRLIISGWDGDEDNFDEALPRALACFESATTSGLHSTVLGGRAVTLRSWRYVVAEIVLWELLRWKGSLVPCT